VGNRILGHLAGDQLLVLEDVLDARVLATLFDVLRVVLHVTAVQHGVLRCCDVDEGRLHARQDVLDAPDVDVSVDLADVVGRPAHVVLDEAASLEHGDLRHARTDLHRHEVPTDRLAVAFAAAALFERCRIEFATF
jgi:hypothetical protein